MYPSSQAVPEHVGQVEMQHHLYLWGVYKLFGGVEIIFGGVHRILDGIHRILERLYRI